MQNDLNELNKILFDTLRGLKDGSINEKKATAITNVSNSLINSAKTQLSAFKLTKGQAYSETFGNPREALKSGDLYQQKSEYAIFKGYDNVTKAIESMGKADFENGFKKWIN